MQLLVEKLNSAAALWYPFVYHVAWQASLLAVVLLVIVRLGRRWPSPLRYWLLVLALAKFALPPLLSLPTGLFTQVGPQVEIHPPIASVPVESPGAPEVVESALSPQPVSAFPQASVALADRTSATLPPRAAARSPKLDGKVWWMLLHAAGSLVVAVWILHGVRGIRRTLGQGREIADGALKLRFIELSAQFGLRRPPRLVLSSEPCGPAAFGVLAPVVILPEAVASLDVSALEPVLAHELAHHRRRDPWVNWLQLALTAAWWFNPLLWILNRQVRRVREDCCDDLLLNRNLTTGPAYCDILLTTASRLTVQATAGVSLGFSDTLHPLGRRFERIMDHTLRRAPRLSLAGIIGLGLLASVVLPGLRQSEGDDARPSARVASAEKSTAEPRDAEVAALGEGDMEKEVAPEAPVEWPEGATVTGRVINYRGQPVANAEVLLLGKERIFVDAERRTWFVPQKEGPRPPTTRTDGSGAFTIKRTMGAANRLAVICEDPLFWTVSRKDLGKETRVEVKLPEAGRLAVNCDLPGKSPALPVMVELKSMDGKRQSPDVLRFHMSEFKLKNPGETVFEHLPPAEFTVQVQFETKTDPNTTLLSGADRQLVMVESGKAVEVQFERKTGRPLKGLVRGLEDVELRYAYLTVQHPGPEEEFEEGRRSRMYVAYDVLPISGDGRFTINPIPPGKYWASLLAVRASTPKLSTQSSDFQGELTFTVPDDGEPPEIEIVAKPNPPKDLAKSKDLRIRVVDQEGERIAKFQVMVHTADQGYTPWTDARDGIHIIGGTFMYRDAPLDVLVRADGFAPAIAKFAGAEREKLSSGDATITLHRGEKVELRFRLPNGMTWPQGVLPEAYFDDLQERVRIMRQSSNRRGNSAAWDFNMLNLREVGAGEFELHLAEDTPRFHVAVHAPGFLQHFEAGPFSRSDVKNGRLEIDVPRPARLDLSFAPGDHPRADILFKSAAINVMWQLQGNSYLDVGDTQTATVMPEFKLTDLAPGNYYVSVRTQPAEGVQPDESTGVNEGAYYDVRILTLKEGQSERIAFRSTAYDPDAFRGDRTAVVRIRSSDGKPAADRKALVTRFDGHYGSQVVFAGPVPVSGEIVLSGITDKKLPFHSMASYQVAVDDKRIGSFDFTKSTKSEEFEFQLAPGVGDLAPDLTLTSLGTGKDVELRSLRGKLVLLEFWATWCGPCQQPMSALNVLAKEQGAAWKDRVAIVPVSIDSGPARVRSHVQQRGWTDLEHLWSGSKNGDDFSAPAARAFAVNGVPEAVLIGRDGRIIWRGHPRDQTDGVDLKARVEQALK